jgi:hypothetical protein
MYVLARYENVKINRASSKILHAAKTCTQDCSQIMVGVVFGGSEIMPPEAIFGASDSSPSRDLGPARASCQIVEKTSYNTVSFWWSKGIN